MSEINNIFNVFRKQIAEASVDMLNSITKQGYEDLVRDYTSHPHPLRGPDNKPITKHKPDVIASIVEVEVNSTSSGASGAIFIGKENEDLEREARIYELYGQRPFGKMLMRYRNAGYIKNMLVDGYPDIDVRIQG